MLLPVYSVAIGNADDGVTLRQRARQLAQLLGFPGNDCVRIATSVSEVARTVYSRGQNGQAEFFLDTTDPQHSLVIRVTDSKTLAFGHTVGAGTPRGVAGIAADVGMAAVGRLMDNFDIQAHAGAGTQILLKKRLPPGAAPLGQERLSAIRKELDRPPSGVVQEVQEQNRELAAALEEIRQRNLEIGHLNRELAETNRGVVALSAELEEKAEQLRAANEVKSRFLSHASHEFRTPLTGIIGLTRLLLNSGEKRSEEERRQLQFILRSAEDLTAIVDDLLDLAKVEAGKIQLYPAEFELSSLLGAMRGLFRPLQAADSVNLVFEEPSGMPPLFTDEGKVGQIVRNLVSNALKFTEKGEVRVSARLLPDSDSVEISVQDTGIGIAPENLSRIFEEFSQVDSPVQRRVKGTGLGLPLVRRLAELLGGGVSVSSTPGMGSTFTVRLARRLNVRAVDPDRPASAVIVDDEEIARYLLRQRLPRVCKTWEAGDGAEGIRIAAAQQPEVIFLDWNMPGMNGGEALAEIRRDPALKDTAVVMITAQPLTAPETEALSALGAVVIQKSALAQSDRITVDPGPPVRVYLNAFSEDR
jgi:signal transduction histidine kinase